MKVIEIYKCLCDEQRLRILNLLKDGPLCVCHLMEILGSDQVKISKQLRYMKQKGIIEGERHAQWMVYSLSITDNPILEKNLKCLQDCASGHLGFKKDAKLRAAIVKRFKTDQSACAAAIFPTQANNTRP